MKCKKNIFAWTLPLAILPIAIPMVSLFSCGKTNETKLNIKFEIDAGYEGSTKVYGERINQKLIIKYDLLTKKDIDLTNSKIQIGSNILAISDYIDQSLQIITIPADKVNNLNVSVALKSVDSNKIKPVITYGSDNIKARTANIEANNNLLIQYAAPFGIDENTIKVNGDDCTGKCDIDFTNKIIRLDKQYIVNPTSGDLSIEIYLSGKAEETAEDYIYRRTFSIMSSNEKNSISCGTCWIIEDATPNVLDDYCYYIATNWHTKLLMDNLKTSNTHDYFTCNKTTDGFDPISSNYLEFTSLEWINNSQMTFDGSTYAIDFMIAKADMSNAINNDTMKAKLDTLNEFNEANGFITNFADTVDDSNNFADADLYCGGYPVSNESKVIWKYHSLTEEKITTTYYKYNSDQYGHSIDNNISLKLIDVSAQYYSNNLLSNDWLKAGASGSMLIMKDTTTPKLNKWKVVGIYWGGFPPTTGQTDKFYPSFSIFNHKVKNFLNFTRW